jgi:hypothetical protein
VLAALLKRTVMRRGIQGGSTFWLLVGAVGLLRKGYDRMARKTETIALAERIRPGDELIFRYPGPPSRQTRKETKVIAKRATAAQLERDRSIAKLTQKADRGGLRARKARKALASLSSAAK